MEKSIVNELVSTLEALKSSGQIGFWILLVGIIVVLALVTAAVMYQRIVIARFQTTSKATGDHLKAIEVTLKQREVGVTERDELRDIFTQQFSFVRETNAELRSEVQRLREQQQALKDSVNQAITLGLQDIRNRLLQTGFKDMMAEIPESVKADVQKALENATDDAVLKIQSRIESWLTGKYPQGLGPETLVRNVEEAVHSVCRKLGIDDARAAAIVQLTLRELEAK